MLGDFPHHRRKNELLAAFRYFARNRDEEGFKRYLNEQLGIEPEDKEYRAALGAFWNLVASVERERNR